MADTIVEKLQKLYKSFVIGNIYIHDEEPDVKKWIDRIESLKEANDCFDQSFNKYICRCDFFPLYKRAILNCAALIAHLISLPRVLRSHEELKKPVDKRLVIERASNVDYEDVIPQELTEKYSELIETTQKGIKKGLLCKEARQLFFRCVKKHPFCFYYNYFVLKELSIHSAYLMKHNPSATAVYVNERNVASPIIRELYETNGRQFISFMHGEYLLQMIQAFFSFSKYYVWDKAYIGMFKNDLKCDVGEYIVYTPGKLKKKWNLEEITPKYDLTYYFSGESAESIKIISDVFHDLQSKGKKCKVRPHPRDSQYHKLIHTCFQDMYIEDPHETSMQESLSDTEYVLGLVTTVLSEAIVEGRKVILDDLSNPDLYHSLVARKYIILQKEYILLSDYLRVQK